jgi:hypothetical protein
MLLVQHVVLMNDEDVGGHTGTWTKAAQQSAARNSQ